MSSPSKACHCGTVLTGRQRLYCSHECRTLASRAAWLAKVYGLTLEDYATILAFQGGVCGICGRPPKSGRSFAVDHAHEEGQRGTVRGLLCFFCNKRILGARTAQILVATARYVTDPPAVRALGRVVEAPGRPKKERKRRARRRRP